MTTLETETMAPPPAKKLKQSVPAVAAAVDLPPELPARALNSAAPPAKNPEHSVGGPSAVDLPPDLWAKALDYVYFDEALALTAVSKCFLRDVPPIVKKLRVRSGESMAVSPAASGRFCGVKDVHVYSFTDTGGIPYNMRNLPPECYQSLRKNTYRLDDATLANVVPFLSTLPQLEFCYLGSPSSKEALIQSERYKRRPTAEYGEHRLRYDTPDHKVKVANLLESACLAYSQGRLPQSFSFGRWLPFQYLTDPGLCMWKNGTSVECKVCAMMCQSIAPLHVLKLDDKQTPCIPFQERVRIVMSRDEERGRSNLTDMLVDELYHLGRSSILLPPDYSTEYHQTVCMPPAFSKMNLLISSGANAKDGRVRQTLVEYREGGLEKSFAGGKRILSLKTYRQLEGLGFEISENDFLLVDTSDRRTDYSMYVFRKEKANLDPNNARLAKERFQAAFNVDMDEVERVVKEIVASVQIMHHEVTPMFVEWGLVERLGIDLIRLRSEHKEAVRILVLESRSWD